MNHGRPRIDTEELRIGITTDNTDLNKSNVLDPRESEKSVARFVTESWRCGILAEVFAFHLDDAAHFVQAGAHAFSDAVAQSFVRRSALQARCRPGSTALALTRIVRSWW